MGIGFDRREIARHEWVLDIQGHPIPVAAISQFLMIIFLFALLVTAYNVGQGDATEQMKMAAYICARNSDPTAGYHCDIQRIGTRVMWVCNDTSGANRLPSAPTFPSFVNITQ
jgi:hypothetical protein